MENQINEFLAVLTEMKRAYNAKMGYTNEAIHPVAYTVNYGKKFAKIVHSGSVFCFVELATGNIYKAASWSAPAKHVRGNIKNGAADVGPYGPAYLRG